MHAYTTDIAHNYMNLANVEMTEPTDTFAHVQLSSSLLHFPDDLHLAVHACQLFLSSADRLINAWL